MRSFQKSEKKITMPYLMLIGTGLNIPSIEKVYLIGTGQDDFLLSLGGEKPKSGTPGAFKYRKPVLELLELLEKTGWLVVASCSSRNRYESGEYVWTLWKSSN